MNFSDEDDEDIQDDQDAIAPDELQEEPTSNLEGTVYVIEIMLVNI